MQKIKMALKDWKQNLKIGNNSNYMIWYYKGTSKNVFITTYMPLKKGWDMNVGEYADIFYYPILEKHFKTRNQALAFAKSYMESE